MKKAKFRSPILMVVSFVRPFWRQIILLVALLTIGTALASVQPLVMAPMVSIALEQVNIFSSAGGESNRLSLSEINLNNVDQFVGQLMDFPRMEVWDIVLVLGGIFLIIVILKAIVDMATFYISTLVRVYSLRNLEGYVFSHLLGMSLDFFNSQRSGEIVSRLEQDTRSTVNNLSGIISSLATAPAMFIFYGYLLVRTNMVLTLLISIIAVFQWTVARLIRPRLRALVRDEIDLIAGINAYLHEIFQNIRVVKSFAAEEFEKVNLKQKVEGMIPVHLSRAIHKHIQEPVVAMVNGIANVGILLLSARELFAGNLTVPGFFLFLYLGRAIIGPISQLGQTYLSIQEMSASAQRLYEISEKTSSITDGSQVIGGFQDSVVFENVSFGYGDDYVLKEINIEIKRGEMLALVGPSGAGKSTLTDLLMRFYDPTEGIIKIDGFDLRHLNAESYRQLFGVVAQENLLFNATIAENISYGRNGIGVDKIQAAAEVANAAEFIEEMPAEYETFVGDRGIRLSGGQRQRIAIARAIAHQPEILILDEATSSLDTESERMVQTAIDRVTQGTTAVVIAHRLSTVINADKIIVLEEGRVLDQGSHQELFGRCNLYRRLCDLQFQMSAIDTQNIGSIEG